MNRALAALDFWKGNFSVMFCFSVSNKFSPLKLRGLIVWESESQKIRQIINSMEYFSSFGNYQATQSTTYDHVKILQHLSKRVCHLAKIVLLSHLGTHKFQLWVRIVQLLLMLHYHSEPSASKYRGGGRKSMHVTIFSGTKTQILPWAWSTQVE